MLFLSASVLLTASCAATAYVNHGYELVLIFGILFGIARGIFDILCVTFLVDVFEEMERPVVLGIWNLGGAIGAMAIQEVVAFTVNVNHLIGWRDLFKAFAVAGAILFVVTSVAISYVPADIHEKHIYARVAGEGEEELYGWELLTSKTVRGGRARRLFISNFFTFMAVSYTLAYHHQGDS